eukprot:TRINITY_DN435_c0_g1_i1.p1 TRINITY_DN435_c0_g1~~TRINITY_DN435_c0_g1_i1.p1  ORF type:complete len:436 (-),score=97.75 TRINITY_DN435_c0_g1_i1:397-1704(-)
MYRFAVLCRTTSLLSRLNFQSTVPLQRVRFSTDDKPAAAAAAEEEIGEPARRGKKSTRLEAAALRKLMIQFDVNAHVLPTKDIADLQLETKPLSEWMNDAMSFDLVKPVWNDELNGKTIDAHTAKEFITQFDAKTHTELQALHPSTYMLMDSLYDICQDQATNHLNRASWMFAHLSGLHDPLHGVKTWGPKARCSVRAHWNSATLSTSPGYFVLKSSREHQLSTICVVASSGPLTENANRGRIFIEAAIPALVNNFALQQKRFVNLLPSLRNLIQKTYESIPSQSPRSEEGKGKMKSHSIYHIRFSGSSAILSQFQFPAEYLNALDSTGNMSSVRHFPVMRMWLPDQQKSEQTATTQQSKPKTTTPKTKKKKENLGTESLSEEKEKEKEKSKTKEPKEVAHRVVGTNLLSREGRMRWWSTMAALRKNIIVRDFDL